MSYDFTRDVLQWNHVLYVLQNLEFAFYSENGVLQLKYINQKTKQSIRFLFYRDTIIWFVYLLSSTVDHMVKVVSNQLTFSDIPSYMPSAASMS